MPTAVGPATYQIRYLAANGDVIDLADGDRWLAQSRHGFGGTDFHEFVSHGVRQQGDTLTGLYAQPRSLEVPIIILPRAQPMNLLRGRLAEAMNPHWGDGTVEYTDRQTGIQSTMLVRPRPVHLDTAARQALYHQETLHFTGHDPLWYRQPAVQVAVPVNGGAVAITNSGSMPSGFTLTIPCPLTPTITLQNIAGGVTYSLQFTTGTYTAGNTVKIVTIFNQKSSVIYPTNTPAQTTDIFPNRGLASIYFPLQRGLNLISLSTANAAETQQATLTYSVSALGV